MRAGWVAVAFAFAGACGGGGGEKAPVFTPVSATTDGMLYTLQLGDLKMVVDGSRGARVTEFSLFGTNALVSHQLSAGNFGSTYWPSPQSSWCAAGGGCWPPPVTIDEQPYTGAVDADNSIHVTSGTASIDSVAGSAIVVDKRFVPAPEHGAVDVTYTLTNTSPDVPVSLAPWQITRVYAGALTFFAPGSGDVTYAPNTDSLFKVKDAAGDRFYASDIVNHDSKAFSDGTGWIAQLTPERLLYVSQATDIQPAEAAAGEAEIEIFTNSNFVYVEVEQQGALTTIAPGEALTWTVRWKLRRAPADTSVAAPTPALAALTDAVLAE